MVSFSQNFLTSFLSPCFCSKFCCCEHIYTSLEKKSLMLTLNGVTFAQPFVKVFKQCAAMPVKPLFCLSYKTPSAAIFFFFFSFSL